MNDLRGSVRELRPGFLEVVRAAVIEDEDGLRAPADPEVRAAALTALYDSWDGDAIRGSAPPASPSCSSSPRSRRSRRRTDATPWRASGSWSRRRTSSRCTAAATT